jgi:ATP-binding cassette subfamily F protein 2
LPTPAFTCRRYGLLGLNGCGKSTMLKALAGRDVPIPDHIDMFLLDREMPASDMTALEAVMSVDKEKLKLEKEAEYLSGLDMTEDVEMRLSDVYERWAAAAGWQLAL